MLNSNIARTSTSAQLNWLRQDLAANPKLCTLAYWHHPRFSSRKHGNDTSVGEFWNALYNAGVDLVLNGHEHIYERFAPQRPNGTADNARGIRQITVGTGGASHGKIMTARANSVVRNNTTYGVLKLTLRAADYSWQFVPEPGKTFGDSGTGNCH